MTELLASLAARNKPAALNPPPPFKLPLNDLSSATMRIEKELSTEWSEAPKQSYQPVASNYQPQPVIISHEMANKIAPRGAILNEPLRPKPVNSSARTARPTSIGVAIDSFGEQGVDTLLGIMYDSDALEGVVTASANSAGAIRRTLMVLLFLVSTAACVISAAPVCPTDFPNTASSDFMTCQNNVTMISAILSALNIVLLFALEKTSARNVAPRLRDISGELAVLSGQLKSALYNSACPAPESTEAYIRSAKSRYDDLKNRALASGIRMVRQRQSV